MQNRNVFKLYEVMQLLKTGKEATLEICSFDRNRPEKSGKPLVLRNVTYISHYGLTQGKVRLANGEPVSFHPVLIKKYNGTKVMP